MGQKIKKVLLYARVNEGDIRNLGVLKKLRGQAEGFKRLGIEADLVTYSHDGWMMNGTLHKKAESPLNTRINQLWFIFFLFDRGVFEIASEKTYDLMYVRYPLSTWSLNCFFEKLKRNNDKLKILVEFPTYPYRFEVKGILKSIQYLIDVCFRGPCFQKVDQIVHLGSEKELFGRPVINSRNGIDVDKYRLSASEPIFNKVRLLAIGSWNYWHGIDRLLDGLKNYYEGRGKEDCIVELKVVGEGGIVSDWRGMVEKYRIANYVTFYTAKSGESLDAFFNEADVAVGTLGSHRKKLKVDSPLKHREYCARGIPFFLAVADLDFPIQFPFVKYFPADDTPIDVVEIVQYCHKVYQEKEIRSKMKAYASNNLDWQERMRMIIVTQKDS